MENNFEHIFLLEDDIYITDPKVFDIYIKTAETTGVLHLNYGYQGPDNRDAEGIPNPRMIITYENNIKLTLNKHVLGAFSYYHREVIEKVGFMNESFQNAWEHVEHTARIAKALYHPPFWWFADVYNSQDLIGEQDITQAKSVIRKDKNLNLKNMISGIEIFKKSTGYYPGNMPLTTSEQVLVDLKIIKDMHGKL
jgi:hypothetical protein